jgi:uncharacterized delta-60 repeat protein
MLKLRLFCLVISFIVSGILTDTVSALPGDLDLSFNSSGGRITSIGDASDTAYDSVVQGDDKVVVVGSSGSAFAIVRYNLDGSLDSTFGDGGKVINDATHLADTAVSVAIQQDGKFIILANTGPFAFIVLRYNTNGTLDTTFGSDGITSVGMFGTVEGGELAIQADGKIIVLNTLTEGLINYAAIFKFNNNGSRDTTFGTQGSLRLTLGRLESYRSLAVQADNKIVIAGEVFSIPTRYDFSCIRFNPDGSLDSSFDTDGKVTIVLGARDDNVSDLKIQADGKIILAGTSEQPPSNYEFTILRYNANGSLDTTFDGDGIVITQRPTADVLFSMSLQSNGKIIAFGKLNSIVVVARYNADGSPDNTFDSDGIVGDTFGANNNIVVSGESQSDGKPIVIGMMSSAPDVNRFDFALMRFNVDGGIDTSYDTDGKVITKEMGSYGDLTSVLYQPDGKIITAGYFFNGDKFGNCLFRYNSDGTLDSTFDGDGKVITSIPQRTLVIYTAALLPDGKIITAGSTFAVGDGNNSFMIARYNSDGSLDTTFDGDGLLYHQISDFNDFIGSIAVQPDGKIVIGGFSFSTSRPVVVRYNTDGSLDTTFNGDGILLISPPGGAQFTRINDISLLQDGRILFVGTVLNGGTNQFLVGRITPTGSLDTTFDSDGILTAQMIDGGSSQVSGLALQSDGKIVLAGTASLSGVNNFSVVRLNSDGSFDTTFDGDGRVTTPQGVGNDVAIQNDGKIVLVGAENSLGYPNSIVIVRYKPNGSLDDSFRSSNSSAVGITRTRFVSAIGHSVVIQPDGKIIAGGIVGGSGNLATPVGYYQETRLALLRYQGGDSASPAIKAPFDFDGDGKTDISIFRPTLGQWWYLRSSDSSNRAFQFGSSTDKIVPADYTDDGKTDIAVFNPSTGFWSILRSEDSTFYGFPFGTSGDIAAPADYDGDGRTDAAVFRPSNSTWFISKSSGGTSIQQFGATGDKPTVADYDGDGKADLAIYRVALGQWWYVRSSDGTNRAFQFGTATDKPIQGDYTGDGKADLAFFRPSTGEWFILRSEDSTFYGFPFGINGDIPASGDYDGDGRLDAAVFRPSNSTWYLNRSTSGIQIVGFGANGDQPVPSTFVP